MRADNSAHLVTSAQRRHELTRAKTIKTLRELDTAGTPVTFEIVAGHAGVSRSWLYTQRDIRAEIERLRSLNRRALPPTTPARQRGTEASLTRRLEIALARNRDLTNDNQRLCRQFARALGQLRAAGLPVADEGAAVPRHSSITIGPC
ncbi:DUF6262 family protein [Streptomyces roseochromogenus]|uniref:Transposase n=1 Tax=Streptomyces roseochromogenus subsp. oscitans DS 12.976 TaxID=1352936 RepID=V6JEV1_STRRC|nr:DUF6262 family protein [Streptomyces roseochromogenus]EST18218.1 hypothetical protein M878_45425 [Streptomyces roseochromogenus subsp. oscitans DS 12.976]